jgi:glycosyltransferase involved in cell wall biosynthesis
MIEAMACGTPVLAFRCGSIPEIIENGVTGEVVNTEEEALAALPKILSYNRRAVRQRFEQIYRDKNGKRLCQYLSEVIEEAHDEPRTADHVAASTQSQGRQRLEHPCRLKDRVQPFGAVAEARPYQSFDRRIAQ